MQGYISFTYPFNVQVFCLIVIYVRDQLIQLVLKLLKILVTALLVLAIRSTSSAYGISCFKLELITFKPAFKLLNP